MALAGELKVMAMQGSSGEESYAQNSALQNLNFHAVGKPVLAEAVNHVVANIAQAPCSRHVAIADLGCSYGRNTLDCAEFILQALQQSWACKGGSSSSEDLEIHYFFSDLPSNDFNALFQSLQSSNSPLTAAAAGAGEERPHIPKMYAAGVPGSFHGRLFPAASLDLVICSYALHWLSQVPPSIIDKSSLAWNGGRTWTHKASQYVLDAYAQQFVIDLKSFLNSRAHELASGGILFLLLASIPNTSGHQKLTMWELIDTAWKEMIDEGIITSEEMDMFNFPLYMISQHELESALMDVPQFKVLHMETKENMAKKEIKQTLDQWMGSMSSVLKPIVGAHLGEFKANVLFTKLKVIASKQDSFKSLSSHYVLSVTLQRL